MKIIKPSYDILRLNIEDDINSIAESYGVCYNKKLPESYEEKCNYIRSHRIHESPLEMSLLVVKFTINRGVSHELVRHRHAAYAQQSTRYCNYSNNRFGNELTFIEDSHVVGTQSYDIWLQGLQNAESEYFKRLKNGQTPEEARGCLPNDLMTQLIVGASYREWRNIFKLRCDSHAHYQMREIMQPLLYELIDLIPCVFDDILRRKFGHLHE